MPHLMIRQLNMHARNRVIRISSTLLVTKLSTLLIRAIYDVMCLNKRKLLKQRTQRPPIGVSRVIVMLSTNEFMYFRCAV